MQRAMTDQERSVASVFYDADCRFCVKTARRFERVLTRRRFELVPLQIPGASAELGTGGELRSRYIAAIKAADAGDFAPIMDFAGSG